MSVSFKLLSTQNPVTIPNNIKFLPCSTYPPNANVACPRILREIKEELVRRTLREGDTPTQYLNTPTCDVRGDFGNRYWGLHSYPKLLNSKTYWDPDNVFHFCQSVGSTDESCCPQLQYTPTSYPRSSYPPQ